MFSYSSFHWTLILSHHRQKKSIAQLILFTIYFISNFSKLYTLYKNRFKLVIIPENDNTGYRSVKHTYTGH